MSEHTTNIQNNSLLDIKHESHITIYVQMKTFFYIKVQNYLQLQLYKPFELRYSTLPDTYTVTREQHNYK